MTRADKFLLAGLLSIALISMGALYSRFSVFPATVESGQAVITVQGKIVRKIELTPGSRFSFIVHGRVGPSTVEVEGLRLRMLEAPCPGKICVRQSWIEHPGQSVVCIPGEILIRIEGTAPLDAVTR